MTTIEQNERDGWTSASSAQADAACPGRHQAQKGMPDTKSKDAMFGTVIHEALAKQSDEGLNSDEASVYESCVSIESKLLVQVFGGDAASIVPIREKRYWVEWKTDRFTLKHSGQIDCVYRKGTKALIIEYKTLPGDVPDSSKNQQLRDQVALLDANTGMLSEVVVVVIQPLVTHSPELCVYGRPEIERSKREMFERVSMSSLENAPRIAGELQCKYCRAKMGCSEYQRSNGESLPSVIVAGLTEIPVSQWTLEHRRLFLDRRKSAQDWLDNCELECKRLLESDPGSVPGWCLKPGRITEKVTDPQKVFDRFSSKGGSLEQFMACLDVGKTKLKDMTKSVTKLKGKKLDDEMDALFDGCVESKQSAPTLAKTEDIK